MSLDCVCRLCVRLRVSRPCECVSLDCVYSVCECACRQCARAVLSPLSAAFPRLALSRGGRAPEGSGGAWGDLCGSGELCTKLRGGGGAAGRLPGRGPALVGNKTKMEKLV